MGDEVGWAVRREGEKGWGSLDMECKWMGSNEEWRGWTGYRVSYNRNYFHKRSFRRALVILRRWREPEIR